MTARGGALRFGFGLEEVELGERVGRGGSGEVCPFDRLDPAFRPRERFHRECRILSRMEHPAFPALYGCGEEDGGATGWALMEWIDGRPLSDFRSAPSHEVVRLAHGIASALDALHVQGVLHRDVAFDNVLVETRRFGLNPRLIDLGIAKEVRSNEDLTMAGAFLGRAAFASPELLTEEGAAGLTDPRSDVFSFGVLLYEWLAGRPPFPGETPDRVLRAQKKRAAPKLEPREGAEAAAGELAAFVESLLETDLEKRPDSETVVRRLAELRRVYPRPPLPPPDAPPSIYRAAAIGYALLPRRYDPPPALPRLRTVLFPEAEPAAAPAAPTTAPRPPGRGAARAAARPAFGGVVLALGILAFAAACALLAFLLFRH